jgi:hypothetical protein
MALHLRGGRVVIISKYILYIRTVCAELISTEIRGGRDISNNVFLFLAVIVIVVAVFGFWIKGFFCSYRS